MTPVTVHCLSGVPLRVQVKDEDTIDELRQKVADAWSEPILLRTICLMTDAVSPPGNSLVLKVGTEFSVLISSSCERDWGAHMEKMSLIEGTQIIVFAGDGRCREDLQSPCRVGKTTLLMRFREIFDSGNWRESKSWTWREDNGCGIRFENCLHEWPDGQSETLVSLWETEARAAFDGKRPRKYADAAVFVILFSLVSRESLESVEKLWYPEIAQQAPDTPIILVGTKSDLCDDPSTLAEMARQGQTPITSQEGHATASQIGAADYIECSSLTGAGLEDVKDAAMWECLMGFKRRGRLSHKSNARSLAEPGDACIIA